MAIIEEFNELQKGVPFSIKAASDDFPFSSGRIHLENDGYFEGVDCEGNLLFGFYDPKQNGSRIILYQCDSKDGGIQVLNGYAVGVKYSLYIGDASQQMPENRSHMYFAQIDYDFGAPGWTRNYKSDLLQSIKIAKSSLCGKAEEMYAKCQWARDEASSYLVGDKTLKELHDFVLKAPVVNRSEVLLHRIQNGFSSFPQALTPQECSTLNTLKFEIKGGPILKGGAFRIMVLPAKEGEKVPVVLAIESPDEMNPYTCINVVNRLNHILCGNLSNESNFVCRASYEGKDCSVVGWNFTDESLTQLAALGYSEKSVSPKEGCFHISLSGPIPGEGGVTIYSNGYCEGLVASADSPDDPPILVFGYMGSSDSYLFLARENCPTEVFEGTFKYGSYCGSVGALNRNSVSHYASSSVALTPGTSENCRLGSLDDVRLDDSFQERFLGRLKTLRENCLNESGWKVYDIFHETRNCDLGIPRCYEEFLLGAGWRSDSYELKGPVYRKK